jgi:hypothetical protein
VPPSRDARGADPEPVAISQRRERAEQTATQTARENVVAIPGKKPENHKKSRKASKKEAATKSYPLLERVWWFHGALCRLTVKLRGLAQAPDWSRGRTVSSSARGDTTALHGPLQRLLGVIVSRECDPKPPP